AADGARNWRRVGNAAATGHRRCGWTAREPAAHALYDAGPLRRARSAALEPARGRFETLRGVSMTSCLKVESEVGSTPAHARSTPGGLAGAAGAPALASLAPLAIDTKLLGPASVCRRAPSLAVILLTVLLTACTVGPPYVHPTVEAPPPAFKEAAAAPGVSWT